jgi:hypothetical protein
MGNEACQVIEKALNDLGIEPREGYPSLTLMLPE